MALTYEQQLNSVQSAITAIEGGVQSYSLPGGQQVTRADLKTLYERESRLMKKVARQTSGGMSVVTGIKE